MGHFVLLEPAGGVLLLGRPRRHSRAHALCPSLRQGPSRSGAVFDRPHLHGERHRRLSDGRQSADRQFAAEPFRPNQRPRRERRCLSALRHRPLRPAHNRFAAGACEDALRRPPSRRRRRSPRRRRSRHRRARHFRPDLRRRQRPRGPRRRSCERHRQSRSNLSDPIYVLFSHRRRGRRHDDDHRPLLRIAVARPRRCRREILCACCRRFYHLHFDGDRADRAPPGPFHPRSRRAETKR